jgi:hypothetical protein
MTGVIVVVGETARTVLMEDSMVALSASTEKMLVPVAASAEMTVVLVVLLKTTVVI